MAPSATATTARSSPRPLGPGTVEGSIGYAYDSDFRVKTLSVNGADPVAYGYDADGLLISAGGLSLSRSTDNGLLTGTSLSSGDHTTTDSLGYDGFGEVTRYSARFDLTELFSVESSYDALGRLTRKSEAVHGVVNTYNYGYDTAGRLTEVKQNGAITATYGYDDNGNRTTVNGTPIATYDSQDRLLAYGAATHTHTANGELQSKAAAGFTTRYRYDVLGNLRHVDLPSGVVIDYLIDGGNRRIGKKVDGTLVQGFLYQDGLRIVAELDGANRVVSRFVYADKGNVPAYLIKGGAAYRIISDHLGSPRLVVNTADGSVAQRIDYDEWGRVVLDTNPGFQPFGYAGGLYDRDTGLVRFGARDYDPETGRWTAKDPIGFGGGDANLYAYVANDPLRWVDPDGRIPIDTLWDIGNLIYDAATGDWTSFAADAAATAIPYVPAGVTKICKKSPVVIGESMKDRVIPKAKEIGGHFYRPRGEWTPAKQERWAKDIKRQVEREERNLIDLGRDPERTVPSEAYSIERKVFSEISHGKEG